MSMVDEYGRPFQYESSFQQQLIEAERQRQAALAQGQPTPGPGAPSGEQAKQLQDLMANYLNPQASISPTVPTLQQRLGQALAGDRPSPERARLVGGLVGNTGLPGSEQVSIADATPAAALFAAHEAGQKVGGALNEGGIPGVGTVADIAATAAGAATKVPFAGKLAVFAGVGARTADREAYNLANKMAREGAAPSDIHEATGWFQGADNKWRFEIPDQPSKLLPNRTQSRIQLAEQIHRDELGGTKAPFTGREPELDKESLRLADERLAAGKPLGETLHHPELYEAYPGAANIPARPETDPRFRGSYDPGQDVISYGGGSPNDRRSTLLHEVQHAIDEREGFARGGNPTLVGKDAQQLIAESGGTLAPDVAANQAYRRQAGEVGARNVQTRRDWPPEKLRDVPPAYSEDVPRADQFVNLRDRYGRSEISAMTDPAQAPGLVQQAFGGKAPPTIPQDVMDLYRQGQSPEPLGSRISQRWPEPQKQAPGSTAPPAWQEGKENPVTQNLLINRSVLDRDPKKVEQAAAAIAQYPNATAAMQEMHPAERLSAMQEQMTQNLLALHDLTPEDIRNRSGRWYWGANQLAQAAARRTGVSTEAAAGTFAALSPQKDWLQNVYLGNTVLDALHADPKFSPEMASVGKSLMTARKTGRPAPRLVFDQDMLKAMEGKRLSELPDDAHKAQFIRMWDEAHGTGQYRDIAPEGEFGAIERTKTGKPKKAGWGSFGEVEKALVAAQSGGDMTAISEAMGGAHKVRNFYNNIVAPDTPAAIGDITADTHQIAAALMRPLSGTHLEVMQGLGTGKGAPQSAATGLAGLYPLYADATREAAARRGIPVPSMQSIPWETIRGLYTKEQKIQGTGEAGADAIWRAHGRGELTLPQAQARLVELGGGYRPPSWAGK